MVAEGWLLCWSAVTIGFMHTLLGPDHYLPFLAMSRAGGWTLRKTLAVTALCGVGHVAGSVCLGAIGIGLGLAVFGLETIESIRGQLAAWLLMAFGLAYLAWGSVRAFRRRSHAHWHVHEGGTVHCHEHRHDSAHLHAHEMKADGPGRSVTPWVLFTVLLFGPCEPLIPLLMYPAARGSGWLVIAVVTLFGLATVGTMTVVVWLGSLRRFSVGGSVSRFSEPIAGLIVLACGVAIQLGL